MFLSKVNGFRQNIDHLTSKNLFPQKGVKFGIMHILNPKEFHQNHTINDIQYL